MAVAVGQRCVVRIKITDIDLRNARAIMATIVSPQGEEKCQDVSFDEVSGVVYASVDVNSAGNWSMWLCVRFAEELFYTPAFVFAEGEGEATPCDAPYIVDVEVAGESVSVTPPKIDVDAVTREEFERLSNAVAGKVDKVAGKGLSTNDYTDAEKAKVADTDGLKQSIEGKANTNGNYPNMTVGKANGVVGINQVQEALTLTTKANGNIVIGNLAGQTKEFMPATPSGDPMHYAYEDAGAVWNANTGYWEMYDMKDVTTEQMRRSYNFGRISTENSAPIAMYDSRAMSNIRFNLPRRGASSGYFSYFGSFASGNFYIEVINLMSTPSMSYDKEQRSQIVNASYAFNYCENLRRVLSFIDFSTATNVEGMFNRCYKLEQINCYGLKQDISFADSHSLSVESILYMIENANLSNAITITLHQDAYMSAMAEDSIIWALENHPNVKLAQA